MTVTSTSDGSGTVSAIAPAGRGARPALDALTSLRFFAALHVVLYHYGAPFAPTPRIRVFMLLGYSAVSFFFLLSGFILAYNYAEDLDARRVTLADFFLARFARIYPLYALIALAELPFLWHLPGLTPTGALSTTIAQLFLLQTWLQRYMNGNTANWSIAVEACLYALFPLIARVSSRVRGRGVLAAGIAVCWFAGPVAIDSLGGRGVLTTGTLEWLRFSPIAHAPTFVGGVLLGRMYLATPRVGDGRSWKGDALALGGLAGLAAFFILPGGQPLERYVALNAGLLSPLFALLIFGLATGRWIPAVLSIRPLVWMGTASYAMYLLQQPLFHALKQFGVPVEPPRGRMGFVVVLCVLALCASYGIERPLRSLVRRRRAWFLAVATSARHAAVPAYAAIAVVLFSLGPVLCPDEPPPEMWRSARGLQLGARAVDGVAEQGFYFDETLDGHPFRWTDGRAFVRIPLLRPARMLLLDVAGGQQDASEVTVTANDQTIWAGPLPTTRTTLMVPLDRVPVQGSVTIRIASPTWSPHDLNSASEDSRRLGVQVFGIRVE